LWFITMRAHEPSFRLRAITLLEQAEVRECFWDSRMTARIARRLIARHEKQGCGVLDKSFKSIAALLEEYHIADD
jgi:hypothetical protein